MSLSFQILSNLIPRLLCAATLEVVDDSRFQDDPIKSIRLLRELPQDIVPKVVGFPEKPTAIAEGPLLLPPPQLLPQPRLLDTDPSLGVPVAGRAWISPLVRHE